MDRKKLYFIVIIACTAGYAWLAIAYFFNIVISNNGINACIIKEATGLPCPSCGSTRAIYSLLQGQFKSAVLINPLGILLLTCMVVFPIWVIYDLTTLNKSFFIFYQKVENLLKRKTIAISAILIVLGNWLWNIYKGL